MNFWSGSPAEDMWCGKIVMEDTCNRPRITFAVSEILVVIAVLSTLFAFLLPGVNAAKIAHQQPVILPYLEPLYEHNAWAFLFLFPVATTGLSVVLVIGIRRILPARFRRYFLWKKRRADEK